jgi:hypothetical protein
VHFVGEFSTAELLDVQQVPTDEHALQDAVREWLDRLAIAWPSALLKNDAAQGFRSPLSVWSTVVGEQASHAHRRLPGTSATARPRSGEVTATSSAASSATTTRARGRARGVEHAGGDGDQRGEHVEVERRGHQLRGDICRHYRRRDRRLALPPRRAGDAGTATHAGIATTPTSATAAIGDQFKLLADVAATAASTATSIAIAVSGGTPAPRTRPGPPSHDHHRRRRRDRKEGAGPGRARRSPPPRSRRRRPRRLAVGPRRYSRSMANKPLIEDVSDQIRPRPPQLQLARLFKTLAQSIEDFQRALAPDEEVALILANFGSRKVVNVREIAYHEPGLLVLHGIDEEGAEVRLVQHVMQMSILLTCFKVEGRQATRIGFTPGD